MNFLGYGRVDLDILIEELSGGLWVAALVQGRLQGLEIDPPLEEVRWGSIYWAKVARIDKALDAAFVNLDGDNIGILHNADIRIRNDDGSYTKGGDVAIGKILEPGQMIAVQAKEAFLADMDEGEPFAKAGHKSPRVSMNIMLHGRYTIHTPMEQQNRISKRIRAGDLRKNLENMLDSIEGRKGIILRAAAANTQTDILVRETKILSTIWSQLQEFFEGDQSQLIMEGPDAIQRMLADKAGNQIERIELTTMDHYEQAEDWCDIYAPDLMPRIKPVEMEDAFEDLVLFEHYDILGQIESLFQPYAILQGGGSIIMENTAAMIVIDVNRGGDDAPVLEVNKQAAEEIARQIRLRNLGGIIVIDFLKMKTKKDREALQTFLQQHIDKDQCTVQIHGWTSLGLMEITRNRRTLPLLERFESAIEQ